MRCGVAVHAAAFLLTLAPSLAARLSSLLPLLMAALQCAGVPSPPSLSVRPQHGGLRARDEHRNRSVPSGPQPVQQHAVLCGSDV